MSEYTRRQIRVGNRRLLRLADMVEKNTHYHQRHFVNFCGAPGCALGTWAAAPGNRKRGWRLNGFSSPVVRERWGVLLQNPEYDEFAINVDEWRRLFASDGCGNANDDEKRAARYLRRFVRQREARLTKEGGSHGPEKQPRR